MKVRFWGTRGSLPAAVTVQEIETKIMKSIRASQGRQFLTDEDLRRFIRHDLPFKVRGTYGTNTSCIELTGGEDYVVCDAGTGLRDFGKHVLTTMPGRSTSSPPVFHLFLSHLHWDHIQGFPFFVPAYIPGTRIIIYGCHQSLRQAFENQQQPLHFPVSLDRMGADITFHTLEPGTLYRIAGFDIRALRQRHPGDSYGYRFEKDGKALVYSTDAEHKQDAVDGLYPFVEFFSDADLVIFDAQYTLLDSIDSKEDWGHSSNLAGVELAVRARARRLCLFHMEHTHDDETLDATLENTREYLRIYTGGNYSLELHLAYDGLELEL